MVAARGQSTCFGRLSPRVARLGAPLPRGDALVGEALTLRVGETAGQTAVEGLRLHAADTARAARLPELSALLVRERGLVVVAAAAAREGDALVGEALALRVADAGPAARRVGTAVGRGRGGGQRVEGEHGHD